MTKRLTEAETELRRQENEELDAFVRSNPNDYVRAQAIREQHFRDRRERNGYLPDE